MLSRTLATALGFLGSVDGNGSFIGSHESRLAFFLRKVFPVYSVPELDSGTCWCGVGLPSCASAIEYGMSRRYIFVSWKRIAVSSWIVLLILDLVFPLVGDGENERWIAPGSCGGFGALSLI
jgi:hypothetical protein